MREALSKRLHATQFASGNSNCQTTIFASPIIRFVPRGSLGFFIAQCERVLARARQLGQATDLTNWGRAAGLSRGTMRTWQDRAEAAAKSADGEEPPRLFMEVRNVEDVADAAGSFGVEGVTAAWLLWGIGDPPRGIPGGMKRQYSDARMERVVVAMEGVLRTEFAESHAHSVDSGVELFKLRTFPETATPSEMAQRLREDVRDAAAMLTPPPAEAITPPAKTKRERGRQ